MKKFLAIVLIIGGAAVLQSCGGAEKCPAYSAVETPTINKV